MESTAAARNEIDVLFVVNSLSPGGTEQSTLLLAPLLRVLGVNVTMVTMKDAPHDLTDEAVAQGTPVIKLERRAFVHQVRELRSLITARRPQIVHTALFEADQLGRLASAFTGVPVISSFVSTPYDPERLRDPNLTRWKVEITRLLDAVTARLFVKRFQAVSEGAKLVNSRALHLPESRTVVTERGRDSSALGECTVERRTSVRRSLEIADRTPLILNLGRIEYSKAHVDLIAAMSVLQTVYPDATALIAGKEGAASGKVRQAIQSADAASAVRLLGHRSDIGDLLCAADVLVISSRFEGTAGVALEAMAVGTPIVSTDLPGLKGILDHERNCVLVSVGDPESIARGIQRVLGDPELAARIAAEGKREFAERFTLDASTQRLAEFYRTVCEVPK
jgi:glycosyltransferase involved in cell wall biosynthesis